MGLARFLPWSAGAVPCGASAITTLGVSESPVKPISTDSAPAIDPKSPSTRSLMQSPSRLRVGTTTASPPWLSSRA